MTILRSACRHKSDPACSWCIAAAKFEAAQKVAEAADKYDAAYFSNPHRFGDLSKEAQAIVAALKEWRKLA